MRRRIYLVILPLVLSASCTLQPAVTPISEAAAAASDYIAAKRAYAAALSKAIGIPDSPSYRLVAVNGPEWQIGDMIAVDNPVNILSYKCRFQQERLPPATHWTTLPEVADKLPIDFSLGLPTGVVTAFHKLSTTAKADFNLTRTGNYSLSDLAGPIVSDSDLHVALDEKTCYADRKGPSLIVRGVISGTETFSSEKAITADSSVSVAGTDLFSLKYDPDRHFQLSEKLPTPKFYILVLDTPANRADPAAEFTAPPADVVAKLESLNVEKPRVR